MSTYNIFIFITTTILWSVTWLAIHFQVQNVATSYSVAYRFIIAGIFLLAYSYLKKQSLKYNLKQHLFLFLQGCLIFSLNFILVYLSAKYLASGLVALIFSLILLMNIINSKLFFQATLPLKFIINALLSLFGLFLIFSNDVILYFQNSVSTQEELIAIILCVAGTACASLGNMLVIQVKNMDMELIPSTGYSMLYGAFCSTIFAIFMQDKITFDFSLEYILSLAYLSIGGSIFGFLCYIKLIRNLGASHAAFVFVFTPITAMIISTFFEELTWEINTYFGLACVSLSQLFILIPKQIWKKIKVFLIN